MKYSSQFLNTLKFIRSHPLTSDHPIKALWRFARWQFQSSFRDEVIFNWIDGANLIVRKGMTGATGNIYCGLHEFADMAFVLHLLREHDIFVDVGANVGTYTVLATKLCGARSVSVEPDPGTMLSFQKNINVNSIQDRVTTVEAALGENKGVAKFTVGRDTVNRMARHDDPVSREVRVETLDSILYDLNPTYMKLDVEGFERQVLKGGWATLRKQSLLAVQTECDAPDVADMLVTAGFNKFFYDPIQRELKTTVVFQSSNSLYVRNRKQVEERIRCAPRRLICNKMI